MVAAAAAAGADVAGCGRWAPQAVQPMVVAPGLAAASQCLQHVETGALGDQRAQCKGPANTGGGEGSGAAGRRQLGRLGGGSGRRQITRPAIDKKSHLDFPRKLAC